MSTMMQQHHPSAERGPAAPGIVFFSTTHPPQLLNGGTATFASILPDIVKEKIAPALGSTRTTLASELRAKESSGLELRQLTRAFE